MSEPNELPGAEGKVPNPPVGMPRILPHLFYNDVAAAVAWLEKAFGFTTRLRMEDKEGKVFHAELEVVDSLIMLGLAPENDHWKSPADGDGRVYSRMFIYVDDIDQHFESAKAAGARIWTEPADQWHGERVYEVIDPEGHRWKFAQAIFEVDQTKLERPE